MSSAASLQIPPSRTAGVVRRVIDVIDAVAQPALIDVENVPASGPFLMVGNHQLLGMQDLPALVRELERHCGVRVRGMADRFHFALPGWRELLVRMGAVPGTRENCRRLLAQGEPVLVFPGGAREVYKRRHQEYQLVWGERTGFARLAIEAGCPIVPLAAVGAEDRFRVVLDMDSRIAGPARSLMRRIGHRDDVGTLLLVGSGPVGLPGTGRLYFRFGEPIATTRWADRADDPEALAECRDLVKAAVESGIANLLAARADDPKRGLWARARGRLPARTVLP
ncbi:MAG TPA: lysophospholipid acyltransferase family protein [Solirubrobacteraceae bacterium]|nr:lysophospholipid acyltransferase family protein [Solirubrobacteraceae bacterium]